MTLMLVTRDNNEDWYHLSFFLSPVVTTMDNIIQETINYTRQRKIFKQPVLYHQAVHFRLAELQTEVELLRSLLYRSTGRRFIEMAKIRGQREVEAVSYIPTYLSETWLGATFRN